MRLPLERLERGGRGHTENPRRLDGGCTTAEPSLFVDDALLTCTGVLGAHSAPLVSISGGQDSDVMLDIINRTGHIQKCTFVFVNTGLEYNATLAHLDYLEDRYHIRIDRIRASVPVPRAIRRHGIPVVGKYPSEMISRLQRAGFDWSDDRPLDALLKDYPRCTEGLKWWTDYHSMTKHTDEPSAFSIRRFKWLKEYIMENPPDFPVSNKCCTESKKKAFHDALKKYDCDLDVMGVRKQEGGVRAQIKTCYSRHEDGPDVYRPIFWLSNEDKRAYCRENKIVHSGCYRIWGFQRTGCTGCPYNPRYREENRIVARYEPKMAHAAECVFGRAYEWQDQYRTFRAEKDAEAYRTRIGVRPLDGWSE